MPVYLPVVFPNRARREVLRQFPAAGDLGAAVEHMPAVVLGGGDDEPGDEAGSLALDSSVQKAVAQTAPKEPFKLAIVAFTTGPAASYGLPGHEMLDLLVPLWNSKGGILGR